MSRERVLLVLSICAYTAILLWAYVDVISGAFAYRGLRYVRPDDADIWWHLTMALLPAFFLPLRLSQVSVAVTWTLYLTTALPTCLIPAMCFPHRATTWLITSGIIASCMVAMGLSHRLKLPERLKAPGSMPLPFMLMVFLLTAGCLALVIADLGWSMKPPSLTSVYDIRWRQDVALSRGNRLTSYALPWASSVLLPGIFTYAILRKNLFVGAAALIFQTSNYAVSGHKAFLLSMLLVPFFIWCVSKPRRFALIVVWACIAVVCAGLYFHYAHGDNRLLYMGVSRAMITPGFLTGAYIDFFSSHPKMYFSHSFLSSFVDNPYGMSPSYLIGYEYRADVTVGSNANLWADGFCNIGYAGIFVATAIYIGVRVVFDALVRGADRRVILPAFWTAGSALGNIGIFTTLLTSGLGLTMVLTYFLPRAPWPTARTTAPTRKRAAPRARAIPKRGPVPPAITPAPRFPFDST